MTRITSLLSMSLVVLISGMSVCFAGPGGDPIVLESIDDEDGFIRNDDFAYLDVIRLGDDGFARTYNSILSFDTTSLAGVTITSAEIELTRATAGSVWGENENEDPDGLGPTMDIKSGLFNDDADILLADFDAPADAEDCADVVNNDWGMTETALDEKLRIPIKPECLSFINTAGRTQFRLNSGMETDSDQALPPRESADAVDWHDGGNDDNSPKLIINANAGGGGVGEPSIYFVSAGTAAAPHESEGLLIDRLENVLGYSVNVVNQEAQNVADALTHDLIFVSESGSSGTTVPFMEEYRKSDVPFIMNELGGLTSALFGSDAFGAATSDIQNIKILDNNHFITENFSVGEIVEVRTSDVGIFVHINPGTSEATILAAANDGDDTQGAIVVMEVGDKFEDDVATTARVAFMFPHSTGVYLEDYTAAGVELIDRVFTWALGLEPVVVPNPVDQQLWTFFE